MKRGKQLRRPEAPAERVYKMEEKIYIESTDHISLCALEGRVSSKKIVVLCHGIRSDKDECGAFAPLSKAIRERGYSSLRMDFRAQGESGGIDYEMTISKEIEDIGSVLDFLTKKGYDEIIVLGASFGASIVSLADYRLFDQVKGLVLWYGALDNYAVLRTDDFLSDRNREIALRDGFCPTYNSEGKLFRFGVPLFDEINLYRPVENLRSITLPKLFVHGLADQVVPYRVSEEACRQCCNARLELIENGSHTFDTDRRSLYEAIEKTVDFVDEVFTANA